MRKEATLEQWKKLYEVGVTIKRLKPWEALWDVELTAVRLPDEEPCFFSVLGRGEECYGINMFTGYDGLKDFVSMAEAEHSTLPVEYIMFEQSNLSLCLGNREEVPKEQKKIIKELGLKFRGKNNWLYFLSYKKGYMPYIPDESEVLHLTEYLELFVEGYKYYIKSGIQVNFAKHEVFLYSYDNEMNEWTGTASPLPDVKIKYPVYEINDDLLKARLKKQKFISSIAEFDLAYLGVAVNDKTFDRPVNMKIALLMDRYSRTVLNQHMLTPNDNVEKIMMNLLVEYLLKSGKPKTIAVRNPYVTGVIQDICKSAGIKIIQEEDLNAVDNFLLEFAKFNSN